MSDDMDTIDKLRIPTANIRRTTNLAAANANIFGMAFSIFMLSAPLMGWFDFESPTLGIVAAFGGLCEYAIGIYDWYEQRSVQSFIDFVFGILNFVVFYSVELGKYDIEVPYEGRTYAQGIFVVLLLIAFLALLVAVKDKGILYVVYTFLLGFGCIFLMVWEFGEKKWARKTSGYFFFVGSVFIWLTGLGNLLNSSFNTNMFAPVLPRL